MHLRAGRLRLRCVRPCGEHPRLRQFGRIKQPSMNQPATTAHVTAGHDPRVGVLLVNTGTPASTSTADVRRYLRQFLSDPRVIDLPPLARFLLLELIILPFRPAKSAHAYKQIWTNRGSPLLVHGQDLAEGVQSALGSQAVVRLAMQFGQPSIPGALDELAALGIDRVVVLPLFPHYAAASFGSAAAAALSHAASRWTVPQLHVVEPFFDHPAFVSALTEHVRGHLAQLRPDHVVLSYHGVPERHCKKTDASGQHCLQRPDCCDRLVAANRNCYRAQCMATSRQLIADLGLDPAQTTTCFQSRLGRTPWIRPYTDHVLTELGQAGKQNVAVVEPSFVADCLETLEEIGVRGAADFRAAGGGKLTLVPSLNAQPAWSAAVAALVRSSCGWFAA